MKRKKHMKSMMLAIVMASALTVSSLPVVAAEIPQGEMENLQVEEETGVVLDEEGEDVLSTESGILDTTPPELHSLSIIGETSVKASETIEVVADATDDISGILDVSISFKTDQDFTGTLYTNCFSVTLSTTYYDEKLQRRVKYGDGRLHGFLKIPENALCGAYFIDSIWMRDNNLNTTVYSDTNWVAANFGLPGYAKTISIQVTENKPAETVDENIKLKSVTLSETSIIAPGSVKISAELEGECSDIAVVRIGFKNTYEKEKFFSGTAELKKEADGKYTGELSLEEYARAGEYKYSFSYYMKKEDIDSNYYNYYYFTELPDYIKDLKIDVASNIIDEEPPVIEKIIPTTDKVSVPGTMVLEVVGGDAVSGVADAVLTFSNGKDSVCCWWYPEETPYVKVQLDQYETPGTYKLSSIDMKDNFGNRVFYGILDPMPEHLKDVSFEVVNDGDSTDLLTSTISKSFLSDVKAAADDAVINVDISADPLLPKDVLDAIKGTGKLLKLNSTRIQWEINGNDIQGETRDVDLYGEIKVGCSSEALSAMLGENKALDICLAENADLPFKAKLRVVPSLAMHYNLGATDHLYLYRYDKERETLDLIDSDVSLTNEKNLEFDITQGGEYILTTGPAKDTSVIPTGPSTWEDKEGTEGFVYRLYNVALTRDAEEAGLSNWNTQLTGKTKTAAEVAQGIFFSEEFQNHEYNDVQYVKLLYRTMFGREADTVGLKGWLDKLDSGMSREYVFRGFAESQEFENLCKSYNIERGTVTLGQYRDKNEGATGYVARLYTKMLGRKFEEKGIEYWCKEYLTGKVTIENIATNGFLHSQEFTNLNLSNEEFVTRMYQTFLNREPDEAGYKDWVGKLNSGEKTRDDLVYGFSLSQEFANLKKSYGL